MLTVGPEPAADAVRKSLQMGADSACTWSTTRSRAPTPLATSRVLAEGDREGRRLGHRALRHGVDRRPMGVVPAMLAERLGVPQVTYAAEVSVDGDGYRDGAPRQRPRHRDGGGAGCRPW